MNPEYQDVFKILKNIYNIDQMLFGEDYIKEIAHRIATTLKVKYVMVGHAIEPDGTKVQTDVMWANNQFVENVVYNLEGTPCVHVLCGTRVSCHASGVAECFPEDKMLTDMGIESYIGAPFLHRDGRLIGLLVIMDDKPMDNQGLMTSVIEFFAARIGTEYQRMAAEDSLRKINETLETAISERTKELSEAFENLKRTQRSMISQEKLAAVGRITFGIAHELKNPLNIIINSSEILLDILKENPDLDMIKKITEMTYEHGLRANNIISSMLKQARHESDSAVEWIDLSDLIAHSLDLSLRSLTDLDFKAKLHIHKDIQPHLRLKITDPSSIERVFNNLFDNALYALRKKMGQTTSIFTPTLWISVKSLAKNITIEVHDNGTGIPTKHLSRIFDEFYTTKPPGEGTGLGLSIAKQAIEKNHGEITINSKDCESTDVLISFPQQGVEREAFL